VLHPPYFKRLFNQRERSAAEAYSARARLCTASAAGFFSPFFFWGGKWPVCGTDFFFCWQNVKKNIAWLRKS
jgi:hypothetical protein